MSRNKQSTPALNVLDENDYDREWLLIRVLLSTMVPDASWMKEELSLFQKKTYNFVL
mgnify:FL=1